MNKEWRVCYVSQSDDGSQRKTAAHGLAHRDHIGAHTLVIVREERVENTWRSRSNKWINRQLYMYPSPPSLSLKRRKTKK